MRTEWILLRAVRNQYAALQQKFLGIVSIALTYPLSLFKFFTLFGASLLVTLTLDNDAISMAYQINTY